MYTINETPMFRRYAADIWRETELEEFIVWLANNPLSGDVIPGTGGLRKVRWSRPGMGKRGGARVIYYNVLDDGCIWLLIIYEGKVRQPAGDVSEATARRGGEWIKN